MKNSPPSHEAYPQQAAQILLRRRNARRRILDFTQFTFPQYVAEPAHVLVANTLDRVVSGEIKRLMLFMPPQNGKSELVSVRLPAFWLGKRPNDPIILASYAASLAESKSRQARRVVESTEYALLFGKRITGLSGRAVDHWSLDPPYRGGMKAAGVGGPITGHGALLGIIDDPFENWEQAQSQTIRDKVWDWYRTTFRTRTWENGAMVIIMTRWHEDDLAGRLLADASEWTVIRLPAIAESQAERDENHRRMHLPIGEPDPLGRVEGEPLMPRRFSLETLVALKRDVGSMGWQAEFQGAPRLAEGNRFKRQWFTLMDAAISTRSAHSASDVWAVGTRTLTSFGTLAADVWSSGTRTLTSFGTLIADIWAYATRTLSAISDSAGITTLLSRIVGTLAAGTHNPQSGDAYARLGANGAGLTDIPNSVGVATILSRIVGTLAAGTHNAQSGDAYARIGATGSGLTSITSTLATIDGLVEQLAEDYVAPDNSNIAAIKAKTDNLPADPADESELEAAIDLVAGAIWDELVSSHTGAGSMGERLGQLANAGNGGVIVPVTITDGDAMPLEGVEVWVSTDEQGESVCASGATNALGMVNFLLDAGTYYVWKQLAGYNFTNPETLEVA